MQKFEITATRGARSEPVTFEVEDNDRDRAIWLAGIQYGGRAAINAHEEGMLDIMLSISDVDMLVKTLASAASVETITVTAV
jgi:hypothetical protein